MSQNNETEPLNNSGDQLLAKEVGSGTTIDSSNDGDGTGNEREKWSNKVEFIVSLIGYSVGLGNVWRFPYLCQKNGGGAFLIPYTFMLVFVGIPIFYLELLVGQHLQAGTIGVWKEVNPYFGGLGWSCLIVSFVVGVYYNVPIAWTLRYLMSSFTDQLPWTNCPVEPEYFNRTFNSSVPVEECSLSDASSYYWYREVLNISADIGESRGVNWNLLAMLLVGWVIVFLCIWKGIKISGKVMYFTAILPYVMLFALFGRAMTLHGAQKGVGHLFFMFKMDRLMDPYVWLDAATQIFYSLSLGFGGLVSYASIYTREGHNLRRVAVFSSLVNLVTSVFTCIVVFAILGFKAQNSYEHCLSRLDSLSLVELTINGSGSNNANYNSLNCSLTRELNSVVKGPGLAFIVFGQVIAELPGSPFWSVLFFGMLLMLGLGSQFGTLEVICMNIRERQFHPYLMKPWVVSGLVCMVSAVLGVAFVHGNGVYWVELFDSFAGKYPLAIIALLEIIAAIYCYGTNRLLVNVSISTYWRLTWNFLTPALLCYTLIDSCIKINSNPPTYLVYDKISARSHPENYPSWCRPIIAALVFVPILPVVLVAIRKTWKRVCPGYNQHEHQPVDGFMLREMAHIA